MVEKSLAVFVDGEVPRTQSLYRQIETQAFKTPKPSGNSSPGVRVDLNVTDEFLSSTVNQTSN